LHFARCFRKARVVSSILTVGSISKLLKSKEFDEPDWPLSVSKKFRIQGHVEGYITGMLPDGSFTTHEVDIGESTFWGRHLNEFDSLYTPIGIVDGAPAFYVQMAGTSMPANRKGSINWVGVNLPVQVVTFTGGTGTAEGAQGSFTSTTLNLQINTDGTLSYDYVGGGEVTFAAK
jgi:hypothetical protein